MNTDSNTRTQPPRLATRFLEWYCAADQFEHIPGDLAELYEQRLRESGKRSADFHYYWDVIRFFRPSAVRMRRDQKQRTLAGGASLFASYAGLAVRKFNRQKGFVALNVAGLAVGFACCIVIFLYVQKEKNFDAFHSRSGDIVRAFNENRYGNQPRYVANTPEPYGEYVRASIPEVENMTRIRRSRERLVKHDGEVHYEGPILTVDPEFFNVFDFELINVSANDALSAPFTCVLTPALARKYFGTEDVTGRTLAIQIWNELRDFEITGLVKTPPDNSHIQFDALLSYASYLQAQAGTRFTDVRDSWFFTGPSTYLLLKSGSDWRAVDAKISQLILDQFKNMGQAEEDFKLTFLLQPLEDIHLGEIGLPIAAAGDLKSLNMFSLIALFILLIACVNYMNLSTARGAARAIEVGIRKVTGARRGQLMAQFLLEAFLLAFAAFLVSLALVAIALPLLYSVSAESITTTHWMRSSVVRWMFVAMLLVGLLAGSYPAFVLSAFRPSSVLKGRYSGECGSGWLRKGLVVGQFVCGIVLIISTLVISDQLEFARNKKLGFDRENVISIPLRSASLRLRKTILRDQFKKAEGVDVASLASSLPDELPSTSWIVPEGIDRESIPRTKALYVDSRYDDALGITVKEGRWFDTGTPTDVDGFVLNEAAVRLFGLDSPVGVMLNNVWFKKKGPVLGVVEDFHFESLHHEIKPLVIQHHSPGGFAANLVLRLAAGNISETLAGLEDLWQRLEPTQPFEFKFLDESLDALYRSEQRLSQLFGLFAGLGIFISCLGLFGLAAYTAQRRTREIGVRKTLGATVASIVALLSREFLLLVLIAILLAFPLAYFGMQDWLSEFAYRKEIGFATLLIPGGLALMIAALTVSGQAIKAALTNPVECLRSD